MKIVVVTPSVEYSRYAGARIRYGRIAPVLAERGTELVLRDIGQFEADNADGDLFLFSKCHDPRSLVAAAILASRGRLVGVDVFDDYFSQLGDSRLSRFRAWFRQMLEICSFALCSTEAMAEVVGGYRRDIPVHVMNDPAGDPNVEELPAILSAKLRRAKETGQLSLAWFGVGDNPHFPVGLHDVAAFGGILRRLGSTGMDVQLRLLTNQRALTGHALAQLRQLPVAPAIEEWSEKREREVLAEAFAAFLPVNLQPFSTAKSLNRAVTALTAGCQLLSVGFPLYSQLDELIYRDPDSLLADLETGSLRLSAERLDVYRDRMSALASSPVEASRLAHFFETLRPSDTAQAMLALVHGHTTNGIAHKMVQSAGGLSVASPVCTAPLGFDVVFRTTEVGVEMLVAERASLHLLPVARKRTRGATSIGGKKFVSLGNAEEEETTLSPLAADAEAALPFQLAIYAQAMDQTRARLTAAFGDCRMIVSEMSALPFPLAS